MARSNSRWTDTEKGALRDLVASGQSVAACAERLNRTEMSIKNMVTLLRLSIIGHDLHAFAKQTDEQAATPIRKQSAKFALDGSNLWAR